MVDSRLAIVAWIVLLVASARADIITHGGITVNIPFVTVGDPGNSNDQTRYPPTDDFVFEDTYGAVSYEYRIGTYEVSENQWNAVSGVAGDLLDDPGTWDGDQPVADISWHEAAMFCNWLTSGDVTAGAYVIDGGGLVTEINRDAATDTYGKIYVLPTRDEWYKAAYYDPDLPWFDGAPSYWDFPTQNSYSHNNGDDMDGIDFEGDLEFDAVFNDGYALSQPNNVDNAGVLSHYGTMGQGGNVWEWDETANGGPCYGVGGGSYATGSGYMDAAFYTSYDATFEGGLMGLRVARIPEPSSLVMFWSFAIGVLLMARRRRILDGS